MIGSTKVPAWPYGEKRVLILRAGLILATLRRSPLYAHRLCFVPRFLLQNDFLPGRVEQSHSNC